MSLFPAPVVPALLIGSLLLVAPDAHAGTYAWTTRDANGAITARSPTYSGGTDSVVPAANGTAPPPMIPYNGIGWLVAPSGGCGADAQGNATTVTLKAQGPLNAKFIWQPAYPGEPAPTAVIIYQDSNAQLTDSRNGYFDTSCTCTDGLGGSATLPSSSSAGTESYRYVSATPGAGGSVSAPSVSPAASCTVSSGAGSGSYAAVAASVGYVATAYPITINLGGTLTNSNGQPVLDSSGNQQILVGQGCTASLAGIPSGCAVSNYSWSVSGTTFQDWEPSTSANSQASFYDPGPGTQTNSTYHWYWNDFSNAAETVKCTATVTPPTGQGAPFSVTVTQNVSVYVPIRSTNTNVVGDGRVLSSAISAHQTPAMMNNLEDFGSSWTTSISMPTTPAFGTGQWCYCQLITPGEYVTSSGVQFETKETTKGDGLDATFPYQNSPQDSGVESADGNTYHNGDSPRLSNLNSTVDDVTLTDTLHTYVMFKPPGNDVRWVPLSESHWDTDFKAYIPAGGWSTFSPSESAGPINLDYSFVRVNKFPMWTQIVQSDQTQTFVPTN